MSLKNIVFGDRVLLVIIILLSLFSFFPVFSSSSYLSYVIDGSSPLYYLVKHFIVLLFGFALMFSIKLIPYNLYKGMSVILMPIGVLLLAYTLSKGTIIQNSYFLYLLLLRSKQLENSLSLKRNMLHLH